MNHNGIFSLSFPEAKTIIVSGDIHGNFNQLVFKLCIQYQLTDTLLIVAGDCGFGFEKKEYYEQIVRRNAKRMNQANNWIVFVRGNHGGRKINCVMRCSRLNSSVGDRPAPRGGTTRPDERKVTTI